jgi:hypothetical protein
MTDQSTNPAPAKRSFDKAELTKDVSWLGARLREPSTYAGLAAVLAVAHLSSDPGLVHSLAMIGTGLGGVIAFILPEQSK